MAEKINSGIARARRGTARRWVLVLVLALGLLAPLAGCSFDSKLSQFADVLVRGSLAYPHGFFNI